MRVSLVLLLLCATAAAGRASVAGTHPTDGGNVPWTAEEIVALCDGTDDGLPW